MKYLSSECENYYFSSTIIIDAIFFLNEKNVVYYPILTLDSVKKMSETTKIKKMYYPRFFKGKNEIVKNSNPFASKRCAACLT